MCQEYLVSLRWQTGYVCPKCGCRYGYQLSNGRYQCAQCRHQASVTAGTVLHKPHMPLTQWFLAFYFLCRDKRGISAVQLAAMLGTTYKTAWYMLRYVLTAIGQQTSVKKFAHAVFYDGSEIHSDIAVTSRRWNAIPMSTNPTILILAFSIDCTSSSVSPRRLFWAPITSAGKDRKATSDGRSLIREGDYVAICA